MFALRYRQRKQKKHVGFDVTGLIEKLTQNKTPSQIINWAFVAIRA
ncbi:hypothetical protein LP414_11470 [Polaromonas sp. P1(28)-13]|nr:hypothetical protein LP414_11470 [Polaromonas sp. P1(28)-13]